MENKQKKISFKKITLIVLVILTGGLFILYFFGEGSFRENLRDLRIRSLSSSSEIKGLERDIVKLENRIVGEISDIRKQNSSAEEKQLDLSIGEFQRINEIFSVFFSEITPDSSGLRIRGEILNQSSVVHRNIKFKIVISGQSAEVDIPEEIRPGYAKDFEAYVPSVSPDIQSASIELVESIMEYYK